MSDWIAGAALLAGLYAVAEMQNRWLGIAFSAIGLAWLLWSMRRDVQARAEDLVKPREERG